jgi:hypothetical protein
VRSSARSAHWVIAVAAAGLAAVAVTACSSPGTTTPLPARSSGTPGSSPSSTATPPGNTGVAGQPNTGSSGLSACTTPALRATVGASDGAAAGSSYYPVQFENISSATCNLYGYPGVSFVTGAGGSQIGLSATENPVHPRQFIDLAPGQTAHAELQVTDAQNYTPADCGVVTATWLRIYPPNQTSPLYASFTERGLVPPARTAGR